jgi:hypothetical protein
MGKFWTLKINKLELYGYDSIYFFNSWRLSSIGFRVFEVDVILGMV